MRPNHDLLLGHIRRHIQLDEAETAFFLSLLQFRVVRRREFLLSAGDVCRYETFVHKGCLRTYSIDERGYEHVLSFAVEDWWAGDLYSFLTQQPAVFFIDALEDTEVWQLSKNNLEKLYEQVPKFERFFRILFQNAFIANQRRINQNLSFTAEERYLQFLQTYPRLEQRLSQKQMAAYLGITPEFLSKLRQKLAGG